MVLLLSLSTVQQKTIVTSL